MRIGRFNTASGEWTFYYYPIERPQSANDGWVGLSKLVSLGNDEFAVVERDNKAGADAVIKRLYKFSTADLTPLADTAMGTTPHFPVVNKHLVRDMIPDLEATGGAILEKTEGLAVLPNGETQLLRLKNLFN